MSALQAQGLRFLNRERFLNRKGIGNSEFCDSQIAQALYAHNKYKQINSISMTLINVTHVLVTALVPANLRCIPLMLIQMLFSTQLPGECVLLFVVQKFIRCDTAVGH